MRGTDVLFESPRQVGAEDGSYVVSPFLHFGGDRIYNPLTDRTITASEPDFRELHEVMSGVFDAGGLPTGTRRRLVASGWLVASGTDLSRRFLLKYVSLEGLTTCNQSCYFCPVSVAPREDHAMPTELYERIVGELGVYRDTIEALFMISYNEPTVDRRFVEQVRCIKEAGLPPAVLTNGTGLTPGRVDAIAEMGGLRFLSINLSTLDREKYKRDRGGDHLGAVLRNLEHAKDKPVAEEMDIVVLGTGDEQHQRDFQDIGERFSGSRFNVKFFIVNDRAGYLQIGLRAGNGRRRIRGCEHMGSRPLQHLHINPYGQCILCCQDYNETQIVGDLRESSVEEVLTGPALARMRRWVYGLEEAPGDFICRSCKFAITE